MTQERCDLHCDLLERATLGEALSPEELERIEDCATCRPALVEHRDVKEELERLGGRERDEVLAAADELATFPGEDEAVAALRAAMAGGARPDATTGTRRRWPILALVAAAAALLVTVRLVMTDSDPPPEPPPVYLGGDFPLTSPLGPVEEYGTFEWNAPLPTLGTFELQIENELDPTAAPTVVEGLTEPRWIPAENETDLPKAIRWEVRVRDASDSVVGVAWGRSSLRR